MNNYHILAAMQDDEIARYLTGHHDLRAFVANLTSFDEELPFEEFITVVSNMPPHKLRIIFEKYGIIKCIITSITQVGYATESVRHLLRTLPGEYETRVREAVSNIDIDLESPYTDPHMDPMVLNREGYVREAVQLIYSHDDNIMYSLEDMMLEVNIIHLHELVTEVLNTFRPDAEVMGYALRSMTADRVNIVIDAMLATGLTHDEIARHVFSETYDDVEDTLTDGVRTAIDRLRDDARDTLLTLLAARPTIITYI